MHKFAVRVVRFCGQLPSTREGNVIAQQLLRAGTGLPANYRAASRARSYKDFVSKMAVAVEEADETVHWLSVLIDAELTSDQEAQELRTEAQELLAICTASHRTAKKRLAGVLEKRGVSRDGLPG